MEDLLGDLIVSDNPSLLSEKAEPREQVGASLPEGVASAAGETSTDHLEASVAYAASEGHQGPASLPEESLQAPAAEGDSSEERIAPHLRPGRADAVDIAGNAPLLASDGTDGTEGAEQQEEEEEEDEEGDAGPSASAGESSDGAEQAIDSDAYVAEEEDAFGDFADITPATASSFPGTSGSAGGSGRGLQGLPGSGSSSSGMSPGSHRHHGHMGLGLAPGGRSSHLALPGGASSVAPSSAVPTEAGSFAGDLSDYGHPSPPHSVAPSRTGGGRKSVASLKTDPVAFYPETVSSSRPNMDGEGGSAWAIKPGTAWAEEVEAEEAKHGPLVSEEAFPSLGEVAKKDVKGSKKGKGTKLSLSDFAAFPVGRSRQLSDKEILLQLPKGSSGLPKEDRDAKGLGGGFKDYGGNRQQGGFGDRERGGREEREPSRADAAGDWGSERKFVPSERGGGGGSGGFGGGGFKDREGGFGDRRGGGGGFGDRPPREERPISEADTADDWGANRKFTPTAGDAGRTGAGGFGGGGFRDRERPAAGPARFSDEPSRADQGDWGARRSTPDSERPGAGAPGARRGYGFSDQPMSQADLEDKWSHRGPPADAGGSSGDRAAPAERPKLKLAPRTKPLPEQQQQQANGAVSSPRGSEADSTGSGSQQEQKPRKSNPFGAARPREEVLKEKGIDYQKEELKMEHGEVLRDATPEEQEMEAEVEGLRKQLDELQTATPDETDTISDLKKELDEKERALYTLQAKLDDELRYSKHRPERERDGPSARSSNTASEDMSGFEPVRNARRERSATAAAGEAATAGSGGSKEQEGAAAAAPAPAAPAGAWGRGGGGSFRDRERDGGRGFGGGGFRDRDGPREGGGGRDGGRGAPPPRERLPNESLAGRAGGGW